MSGNVPAWQISTPRRWESAYEEWREEWSKGRNAILTVGPGSRIEYIGPRRPVYNWAEGTLAVQARREARRILREDLLNWQADHYNKLILLGSIQGVLRQLGIKDV